MKLTNEHIFGDWISAVISTPPMHVQGRTQDPETREITTLFERQEAPFERTKIKCLCTDCNSGWGSPLEARVGLLLRPMICDELRLVGASGGHDLATWAAKVAILRDAKQPREHRCMNPELGLWLRTHSEPPPGVRVWLARSTVRVHGTRYVRSRLQHGALLDSSQHGRVIAQSPVAPDSFYSVNVFGAVLLVVAATNSRIFQLRDVRPHLPGFFVRLWPQPESFRWPLAEGFDLDQINTLSENPGPFLQRRG